MVIEELIEMLRKHPPNMRVVRCGYEAGFADVNSLEEIPIILNKNTAWFYGPHSKCEENNKDETALVVF